MKQKRFFQLMPSNLLQLLTLMLILLSIPLSSHAITWEIMDPCQNKIAYKGTKIIPLNPRPTLGQFTVERLQENRIPFLGNPSGLGSILNTPKGDESLVVLSDTEMYAYGWCYHLNGQELGAMPDEVMLLNQNDHITWFYAYAIYRSGQWVTMCNPAHKAPLKPYCR